jgi:alkylation response protein AidB-like acyl-CoA dehydrogenase
MMATATANDAQSILDSAIALAPQIRAAAAEIEAGRRLPSHIVDALTAAGVFRMAMPRDWGGPEVDPLTQLRVIEALARADGAVGWCAMINSDGGYFSAFIDQDSARQMYRDLDAPTAACLFSAGQARQAAGGYRVSGRWSFVSGCQHSVWFLGSCIVYDAQTARTRDGGGPEVRMCFIPVERGEIIDTWVSTGLRGSGSHDFAVSDVFVPAEQTYDLNHIKVRRPGPLYAFPMMFAYNLPAVTLGVARGALDTFVEAASPRQVSYGAITGVKRKLGEEAHVQSALGRAEALVGSARSYVYEQMGGIWETLQAGQRLSIEQRARYRLAMIHAHGACAEAVALLYKANGGSSVYAGGALERCFRDAHTANQHTMNNLKIYETAGCALLGMEVGRSLL